jgi:hypothetical protein
MGDAQASVVEHTLAVEFNGRMEHDAIYLHADDVDTVLVGQPAAPEG